MASQSSWHFQKFKVDFSSRTSSPMIENYEVGLSKLWYRVTYCNWYVSYWDPYENNYCMWWMIYGNHKCALNTRMHALDVDSHCALSNISHCDAIGSWPMVSSLVSSCATWSVFTEILPFSLSPFWGLPRLHRPSRGLDLNAIIGCMRHTDSNCTVNGSVENWPR